MNTYTFNYKNNKSSNAVINSLETNGFAKIINLFPENCIHELINNVDEGFEKTPSICGSFGYTMKDHFRRYIYPPLMMGSPLKEVILNKFLIKIIENYFKSEPVITELHIKHDEPTHYIYFSSTSRFISRLEKLPLLKESVK